jgi:hypothetical protein
VRRPTGVSALAIAAFISGGVHFLIAFLALASGSWMSAGASSGYYNSLVAPYVDAAGDLGFWIGLLGMLAAGVTLAAAAGLWVLSSWGYWLALIGAAINLVADVAQLLNGTATSLTWLGALICVAIIAYLSRPTIKHAFDGFPIDAPTQYT